MLPETHLGRVRFLLFQPVDAIRFARQTPADELRELKAAAGFLLFFNFLLAMTLHHYAGSIETVPGVGAALNVMLVNGQRVFDVFAWGMFLYLVVYRRRS